MVDYDPRKLCEHFKLFGAKTAAIIGGGAVGSYIAEFLAKLGVGTIRVIDFDAYDAANAAKHSCIIQEGDTGKSKALSLADRVQALMIPGGKAAGFAGDITCFGPHAFEDVDALFLALDNYAAKIYINQIWLRIPPEKRPILFSGGTYEELAGAICLDGSEVCLRCTISEDVVKNGRVRTSCDGPQLRTEPDGSSSVSVVRTSNLASVQAALRLVQDYRDWVLGDRKAVNTEWIYTPALNRQGEAYKPIKKKNCPDCGSVHQGSVHQGSVHQHAEAMPIEGNVLDLSLGRLYQQLDGVMEGLPYYVEPNILRFNEISYSGVIADAYCRHCGASLGKLYRHEGRTTPSDLLCDACKARGEAPVPGDASRPGDSVLHALDPADTPRELLEKSLFDLGFPIGGDIVVHIPGEGRTELDGDDRKLLCTCKGDPALLNDSLDLLKQEGGE